MSVDVADTRTGLVDLRCPGVDLPGRDGICHPGKLLAKVYLSGERPSFIHPDNLIELPCPECKYWIKKNGRPVRQVLHRYDLSGDLVETLLIDGGLAGPAGQAGIDCPPLGTRSVIAVLYALYVPACWAVAAIMAVVMAWRYRMCCPLPGDASPGDLHICVHGRAWQNGREGWFRLTAVGYRRRLCRDLHAEIERLGKR